jgi:hypothetical protein
MTNLLHQIDLFCQENGLSESQFGILSIRDKNLVPQLRGIGNSRPRRLWPETEQRVRSFMEAYSLGESA